MNIYLPIGFLLTLLGSAVIYLASANQRWRNNRWPTHPARSTGLLLLAGGLIAMLQTLQIAAAIFVFIHWLMLLLIFFPYLGALLSAYRTTRP